MKIHRIHFIALVILGGYAVLSKVNFVNALTNTNIVYMFFQLYLFGIFFGCLFLYLFCHDKFFPVAAEIEKNEEEKEKKFLKKYLHHGKILGTFIIGSIGGPIFASLTARILLKNYKFKYLVIIIANIPSTALAVAMGKGLLHLF